jgi:hypothetical protein
MRDEKRRKTQKDENRSKFESGRMARALPFNSLLT